MLTKNYLSLSKLSLFLDKLKVTFATKEELSQMTYKIRVVTQSEYDALAKPDDNTIYVIERTTT